jgi:hypothetical protein
LLMAPRRRLQSCATAALSVQVERLVSARRAQPTRGFYIAAAGALALSVGTLLLAAAESPIAIATGLVAGIGYFALARDARRGRRLWR